MARILATQDVDAIFSYAGRTRSPVAQPLPTRIGGFGGAQGLAGYLRDQAITHLIDATHPFAAQIGTNAVLAAQTTGTPLAVLERPEWVAQPGDKWTRVHSIQAAADALPNHPTGVFLAIGRQSLTPFAGLPHRWLLRFADFDHSQPVPLGADLVVSRGPYTKQADIALMRRHGIGIVVSKNAGGQGARAKLDAARDLNLPVIMIDRPVMPARLILPDPQSVLRWLGL